MPLDPQRREFLKRAAALAGVAALAPLRAAASTTAPSAPPNIVVVLTDDQGYGDASCQGAQDLRTPHLDALAAEGTRFTAFYSAASVCSPSRAALLTGRYPPRTGVRRVIFPDQRAGIRPDVRTLAELLRPAGYVSGFLGKWHVGHQPGQLPTHRGFDEFFGIPYSHDMRPAFDSPPRTYPPLPLFEQDRVVGHEPPTAWLTEQLTRRAVEFIHRRRRTPFALFVSHVLPHVPLETAAASRGRSARGAYGDAIEELDDALGRIVGALREDALLDRTLVVFLSDNGPKPGEDGGSAGLLRGHKNTSWEGGFRVPCVMRAPGLVAAGRVCDSVVTSMDLYPTLAGWTGAQARLETEPPLDGVDLRRLLAGDTDAGRAERPFLYFAARRCEAIRVGAHKLRVMDDEPQLFDLERDPGETTNLAGKRPDLVGALAARMKRLEEEVTATAPATAPATSPEGGRP